MLPGAGPRVAVRSRQGPSSPVSMIQTWVPAQAAAVGGPGSPHGQQHVVQQPGEGLPRPGTHAAAARLAFTPPQARQLATSWAAPAVPTTPQANAHSRLWLGGSEQHAGSRGPAHLAQQVLTPPPITGSLEAETPSPSSTVCQVMRVSRQVTPLAAQQPLSYTGVPVSAPGGYPVQASSSYCAAAVAPGAVQAAAAARAAAAAQVQGHPAAWTTTPSSSSSCSAGGRLSEVAAQCAQYMPGCLQRPSRSRPVPGPAQAAAKSPEPPELSEAAPSALGGLHRPSPLSSHNEKEPAAAPSEEPEEMPCGDEAAVSVSCIKRHLEDEEPRQLRPHLYRNYPTRGLYV
eukprot:TRINITY_DN20456_c0_g1_i1.p1 TRINITY_DN20456_c0_g1~~TRINITY_DN20456_c0_g1_i1.p1  ORF type:complete len:344 (+),score=61.31 TRINITY_DN20456_c0_g1_i1:69-1100(+)